MNWLSKINPRRISGEAWKKEKFKAASVLYGFDPVVRQATKVMMKRMWYRHIDKALEKKTTSGDARHWKKMAKTFKHEIAGTPTQDTSALLNWLEAMPSKVKRGAITKEDYSEWLPRFKVYMMDCEKNATQNYILKNKLTEGFE